MSDESTNNDEEAIWSLNEAPKDLTSDERIAQVEEQAEVNYEKEKKEREIKLERLKNDRENPDSRKSWQNEKVRGEVNGQDTNARRVFTRPSSRIFGLTGKSNIFKSTSKLNRANKFLDKNTNVSTKERKTFLNALECFKDKRTGILSRQAVRRMSGLIRTGQVGTNKRMRDAVEGLKAKGLIKDKKDLRRIISRGAVRKMSAVLTRREDDSLTPSRFNKPDNPRLTGGDRGAPSSRRP